MNWLIVRFLCGFLAVTHLTAAVADPVLEPDATLKSLNRPLPSRPFLRRLCLTA